MSPEILAAIIGAVGVIIAAIIGLIPVLIKQVRDKNNTNKKIFAGVYNVYYQYGSLERASDELVYSKLVLRENGIAEFHNNIASLKSNPEYTYKGVWDMDQDIIYANTKSTDSKERLNMILMTSLGEKNRMLGILAALSATASPVAVKFACFRAHSEPENFDVNVLISIFEQTNRNWKRNILMFEEREKTRFFSNDIKTKTK